MSTVILAGGRGFVGGHLLVALIARGYRVISIDSGLFEPSVVFTEFTSNPKIPLLDITLDISQGETIGTLTALCEPEQSVIAIINCSGPARPSYYLAEPVVTAKSIVFGVSNLLEVAKKVGAKYIHASSSEVYGDLGAKRISEQENGSVDTMSSRSVYAEAKRYAETLSAAYSKKHAVEVVILRLFNCYGPKYARDDDRVIPAFIASIVNGSPLQLHGSGEQVRSFCYIDDVVNAFMLSLEQVKDQFVCMNIGNPEPTSINNLARMVSDLSSKEMCVSRLEERPDEIGYRMPDVSLAKLLIGWSPVISLTQGLRICVSDAGVVRNVLENRISA